MISTVDVLYPKIDLAFLLFQIFPSTISILVSMGMEMLRLPTVFHSLVYSRLRGNSEKEQRKKKILI